MDQPRVKQAEVDWKFNPNRHERRRHKDDQFRFYFSGFWIRSPIGWVMALPSIPG